MSFPRYSKCIGIGAEWLGKVSEHSHKLSRSQIGSSLPRKGATLSHLLSWSQYLQIAEERSHTDNP